MNFIKRGVTFGAALIAKNEEDKIAEAVNSVKEFCSQVVVVDTGSDDRTPRICLSLGCELYFFSWRDDFSAARNFALRHMRTDWIISLDADEAFRYDAAKFEELSEFLKNPHSGGISVKLKNYLNPDDPEHFSIHRYSRIFRNHPEIRFSGRVHEQVRPSIEKLELEILETEIEIDHFGYKETSDIKMKRNLEMLESELKENPDDPWIKYHIGETEFAAGNNIRAKEMFASILESPLLSKEQKEISGLRLAQISLGEDDWEAVREYLDFRSNEPAREGFRLFILASTLIQEGRFTDALNIYESDIVRSSPIVDKNILYESIEQLKKITG